MPPKTLTLSFDGEVLERGFWLYVWEITKKNAAKLYYVGRTGDSSSNKAQSPFNRMSQHFGFNNRNNVMRKRLVKKGIKPEECKFRLVARGPLHPEAPTKALHRKRRDWTAALEKKLADSMEEVGYDMLNGVGCRKTLDKKAWKKVLAVFANEFPKLQNLESNS